MSPPDADRPARIAVIGAGFSGTLTALHLLWRCRKGERVYLVERRGTFGPGTAYDTDNPDHLVNVRAENMSAFPEEPDHFVRWLKALPSEERNDAAVATDAGTFVRRGVYGRYLSGLLADALERQGADRNLFLVNDAAAAIRRTDGGELEFQVAGGRRFSVDVAILATGNQPAAKPFGPAHYVDPWSPAATADLDPERPVLLRGTSLTMADLCLQLERAGFAGEIIAVSRRGLLPQPHRPSRPWPHFRLDAEDRRSLVLLMRAVRREVALAGSESVDWRSVLDAMRPLLPRLWRELSDADRARFVRHLRPWWESHRHRLAPPVADRIRALIDAGRLRVVAGRIETIEPRGDGLDVGLRYRGSSAVHGLHVQRLIDGIGPALDLAESEEPLFRQLVADGLIRPDPLGLGIDVGIRGTCRPVAGEPTGQLYAVGPVTRGAFWEITAVPEISARAEQVAIVALDAARKRAAPEPLSA